MAYATFWYPLGRMRRGGLYAFESEYWVVVNLGDHVDRDEFLLSFVFWLLNYRLI